MHRLLALREQLETDHASAEDHAEWEADLKELELLVRRLRERMVSGAKV